MNAPAASWKIFRAICIVQLILVAFNGIVAFSHLITRNSKVISILDLTAYTLIFVFVYQGLSLLNDNYPDTPLSTSQKRSFNILFLLNFFLIAYLFAQVVNYWPWMLLLWDGTQKISTAYLFTLSAQIIIAVLIFILHFVSLGGMYQLRRQLHTNAIGGWYQQFDDKQ